MLYLGIFLLVYACHKECLICLVDLPHPSPSQYPPVSPLNKGERFGHH